MSNAGWLLVGAIAMVGCIDQTYRPPPARERTVVAGVSRNGGASSAPAPPPQPSAPPAQVDAAYERCVDVNTNLCLSLDDPSECFAELCDP